MSGISGLEMTPWEQERVKRMLEADRKANYYKPPYLRDTLIGTVLAILICLWIGWVFL